MTRGAFRYTVMAIPWGAPLIAAAVTTVLAVSGAGDNKAFPLQVGAVLLAGAAGFALDDPAFELLAASPTSLWRRRIGRIAVVLPPTIVLWALMALIVGSEGVEPTLTLVAILAGALGLALGISGVVGHRTRGRGGPFTAPVLLMAIIVSGVLPPALRPLPMGDIPGGWPALQVRWATAAVVGVIALLISSRDVVHRRIRSGAWRATDDG